MSDPKIKETVSLYRGDLTVPDIDNPRLFTGKWDEVSAPQNITVTWLDSFLTIPFSLQISYQKINKTIDIYRNESYDITIKMIKQAD